MVLTGHSLGRNKLEQLLKQGRQSKEDINSTYKIMRRVEAEELSLDAAELVITSTKQEIDEQWGLYDGFDVKLEKVLRARARRGVNCHGRYMPRMAVIPPGMDFSNVIAQEDTAEVDGELVALTNGDGASPKALPPIWSEVMRFLTNPHKPMILALSRPDPKKNITTLAAHYADAIGPCYGIPNYCDVWDELKVWWSRTLRNGGKIPSTEDLETKLRQRIKLGF
ncbi:probable sucrose-phosphate synthase 3 [Coffea eugenioides]|uniref:probable sucrose-phosphate synthase 3 n=1 Tax=Coffea eugenioides TaxID=49369 RepID=UPI000F60C4A0|nr:probable sucrose-phosphate synthase 3 [Coffea eugenioides]XP_027171879.1 probable sucrose-phosphate synthase 3 [Coffea eugenioides]